MHTLYDIRYTLYPQPYHIPNPSFTSQYPRTMVEPATHLQLTHTYHYQSNQSLSQHLPPQTHLQTPLTYYAIAIL
jgi:hypothetical protein